MPPKPTSIAAKPIGNWNGTRFPRGTRTKMFLEVPERQFQSQRTESRSRDCVFPGKESGGPAWNWCGSTSVVGSPCSSIGFARGSRPACQGSSSYSATWSHTCCRFWQPSSWARVGLLGVFLYALQSPTPSTASRQAVRRPSLGTGPCNPLPSRIAMTQVSRQGRGHVQSAGAKWRSTTRVCPRCENRIS